jgi:hypothetical protein
MCVFNVGLAGLERFGVESFLSRYDANHSVPLQQEQPPPPDPPADSSSSSTGTFLPTTKMVVAVVLQWCQSGSRCTWLTSVLDCDVGAK